jgi:YtkA-like
MKFLVALIFLSVSQIAVAVCVDGKSDHQYSAKSGEYNVGFTPSLLPIPVGKQFNVAFEICALNEKPLPSDVKIDADMPAHKHGMNYKAKVSKNGNGYLAEGLMFHMRGKWRVTFELEKKEVAATSVRLSQEITIE